jgi:hypothetical protein
MVPLIEIQKEKTPTHPIVRISETIPGSVWQYTGAALSALDGSPDRRASHDLNSAAGIAASRLTDKVSSRGITVELIIDPLIPPLGVENRRILPIVMAIAENASASVEPGPGTVTLQTWLTDKFAGVDAVGMGGVLPFPIRENLTRPGFTTRIADWDTGFGLHAAMEAALSIAARVELFEPDGSVGFRLAIPIKQGSPLEPSELQTGLTGPESEHRGITLRDSDQLSCYMLAHLESQKNVFNNGIIQA